MAVLAKRLFDLYPPQDVGDARAVLAGVIELFESYPPEIVQKAVSVVFGIPSKYKFIPRISEIKEFLDGLMPARPMPRAYPLLPALPEPDRSTRPTYEELQARCARDGLFIGQAKSPMRNEEIARAAEEFREQNNVSDDVWNSIPNAPKEY